MSNKTNNLKEFCVGNNLVYPQKAMNAFEGKRNNLVLLIEMIENVFEDFLTLELKNKKAVPATTTFLDKGAIYIEIFAVNVISLTDIMAEIIKTIFNIEIKSDENVYFGSIKDKLNSKNKQHKHIKRKMECICKLPEYKYMKQLCNYVKHRNCALTTYHLSTEKSEGLKIKDFTTTNGEIIKGCSCNELFDKYSKLYKALIDCYNEIFKIYN